MDPFNEPTPQNPTPMDQIGANYRTAFDLRYNGDRAPFGVYVHPVWLGKAQPPTIPDGAAKAKMINDFIDWALAKKDVWMITNAQLIEYMKDPVCFKLWLLRENEQEELTNADFCIYDRSQPTN